MGTIQIALSATKFRKRIDPRILYPFIAACWSNAGLFLVGAMSAKGRGVYGNPSIQKITLLSFTIKTVAWSYMAIKAIKEELFADE